MKQNDRWQKDMYDHFYASETIGSKQFRDLAIKEATFLVKTLGLRPGSQLLDVPCGTGRHSAVFAKQGLKVTGLDISDACLKLAKKECRNKAVAIQKGDMSKLTKHREKYDAVVNLFSSFGYFSTEQKNMQVLRELVGALKPNGQLAIHLINRDWLMKVFRPVEWYTKKGKFILEARKYDPVSYYNEVKLIVVETKTNKAKVYEHRMRLYSHQEILDMMRSCGLEDVRVLGNFDGDAFDPLKSSHPIYLGRKPS